MDASRNPRQQAAPQISALEFDEAKETMESKYLLYQAESKASGNVGKEYGLKKMGEPLFRLRQSWLALANNSLR